MRRIVAVSFAVVLSLPAFAQSLYTIALQDFEGAFPAGKWFVEGSPTWDDTSYRDSTLGTGSWSAWCAGTSLSPPGPYSAYMDAWMVFGPFSLENASSAFVELDAWLDTEPGYDYFYVGVSLDNSTYYGNTYSADFGWTHITLDLSDVEGLYTFLGDTNIYLGINFSSDSSFHYEGAYVDNIEIYEYSSVTGGSPQPSGSSPSSSGCGTPDVGVPGVVTFLAPIAAAVIALRRRRSLAVVRS